MVTTTDFETTVRNDVAAIQRELEELTRQEEALRLKRAELGARLAERSTALKVVREIMGIKEPTAPSIPFESEIPMGTIAEMAEQYMLAHRGVADVSDLVTFLRQRGKLPLSGDKHGHYGTVFGTLRKHKKFTKVADTPGRFALVSLSLST